MKISLIIHFSVFFLCVSFARAEGIDKYRKLVLDGSGTPMVFKFLIGNRDVFAQNVLNWKNELSNLPEKNIRPLIEELGIEVRGETEEAPLSWKMIIVALSAFNSESIIKEKLSFRVVSHMDGIGGLCVGNGCRFNKQELEKLTFSPEYLDGSSLYTVPGLKGLHLAIHEIAHTLQPFHSLDYTSAFHRDWTKALSESQTISKYGTTNINESFAEAVTASILDPFFVCYAPLLADLVISYNILRPELSERMERYSRLCENPIFAEIIKMRSSMFSSN